jgi:hypothetical protein
MCKPYSPNAKTDWEDKCSTHCDGNYAGSLDFLTWGKNSHFNNIEYGTEQTMNEWKGAKDFASILYKG